MTVSDLHQLLLNKLITESHYLKCFRVGSFGLKANFILYLHHFTKVQFEKLG